MDEPSVITVEVDEQRSFRDLMGQLPTGVAVVTSVGDEGEPLGMAINSITSVSLEPPMVLFCAGHASETWPPIERTGRFCVNFLSAGAEAISRRFASKDVVRFRSVAYSPSLNGLPVVDAAVAWIECELEDVHPAGDHVIVVGRVGAYEVIGGEPLVFHRGVYRQLRQEAGVA